MSELSSMADSLDGKLSSSQKSQLIEQVQQELAIANMQELLEKTTSKCFSKCIPKPGTSLYNSEQKCISMCTDRYMDAWNVVGRAYSARIQREFR
ncbi:mitochondrial import inner membrane translocase subunit Tim13-B [Galendromus occidentalis]|uniref:Mitochondrial import inner membrane translocase subunit n=1 Tax=Galendromus occidentalis TaxID=34638 RepID=A0AAJ6QPP8_9ACAR|nr:mitochondrial import inner membrane translocase subunit Tim13-B [Galendromus occidentalis]